MKKLVVDGVIESVIVTALVEFREDLGKLKKKMAKKRLGTEEAEGQDAAAKDALDQLGWVPTTKGKSSSTEVIDDTLPLPFDEHAPPPAPRARVQCAKCARNFMVPAGDALRACPDCGTIHRVKSDEDGTVHQRRPLVRPPAEILELMVREQSEDLAPLTKREEKVLANWRAANPDHLDNGEDVEPGDRVADPDVPGSGNAYWIGCRQIAGTDCDGFEATDTPGSALCPKCGQKYSVELTDGKVVVRCWTLDDEAEQQE